MVQTLASVCCVLEQSHFICIASFHSAVKWVPGEDNLMMGVQCYELLGGIALINHAFLWYESQGKHAISTNFLCFLLLENQVYWHWREFIYKVFLYIHFQFTRYTLSNRRMPRKWAVFVFQNCCSKLLCHRCQFNVFGILHFDFVIAFGCALSTADIFKWWHVLLLTCITVDMFHRWHVSLLTRLTADTFHRCHVSPLTCFTADTFHSWHVSPLARFTADTFRGWHVSPLTRFFFRWLCFAAAVGFIYCSLLCCRMWWWYRPHPVREHAQDLRPPLGARPASPPHVKQRSHPTGSVHKSQTVSVVGMSGQLKRCNESWFRFLQSGQFAAGWLAGSILCR